MTPSLFEGTDAVDEWTFMQLPDARKKIRAHHQSFITEKDFAWLAKHNVQLVRVPVGYWIFDGDDPYIGAIDRLDWVFYIAKRYGIKVLICLHGAPGSQNGNDHSGRICTPNWQKSYECQRQTHDVLLKLAQRYNDREELWGIELLNEPKVTIWKPVVRRFYRTSFERLSTVLRKDVHIIFHDGFKPRYMSGAIGSRARRAMMDIHWYHFTDWLHRRLPLSWFFALVKMRAGFIHRLQKHQRVIIGEWSGVLDGNKMRKYTKEQQERYARHYIQLQKTAYDKADAWCYWSYRTEANDTWSYRTMVERGWLT